MPRSKEILFLLILLLGAAAFVLWSVAERRASLRATPAPSATPKSLGPVAAEQPSVPLGGPNEGKTIDFSSGRPVVKDTPEDRAALEAALKDIAEATRDATFPAASKTAVQPTEPKKP